MTEGRRRSRDRRVGQAEDNLIRDASAGSRQAFGALGRRCKASVHAYVLSRVADLEEAVVHALARLLPKNAAAVTLYYCDGLTQRECAEFLGISHKAGEQARRNALAALPTGLDRAYTYPVIEAIHEPWPWSDSPRNSAASSAKDTG